MSYNFSIDGKIKAVKERLLHLDNKRDVVASDDNDREDVRSSVAYNCRLIFCGLKRDMLSGETSNFFTKGSI